MPQVFEYWFLTLLFLISAWIVSGVYVSFQKLGKMQTKEQLQKQGFTYYHKILTYFVRKHEWDALRFSLSVSKLIFYLLFSLCFFTFFLLSKDNQIPDAAEPIFFLLKALITLIVVLTAESTVEILCSGNTKFWFKTLSLPSSILLILTLPLTLIFIKIAALFIPKKSTLDPSHSFRVQDKLMEWLKDSDIESHLEKNEKKLLAAVLTFKDRIAREVMVPRISVFSMDLHTKLVDAAQFFIQEGYSRIPVYKDNVDSIVGVILYKDLFQKIIESRNDLKALENKTVESLVKPVVYTPETKKISVLLQEFRSKKLHLAIVVDEYGGTEGIVTIEDILEELVGEIEDEYDVQTTELISSAGVGCWIIEAKMSIIDIEEEIGIKIPQSPEYDTIGGFVFHKAGSIPSKGWKVHLDDFDLEVLSSDERSINKIKVLQSAVKK